MRITIKICFRCFICKKRGIDDIPTMVIVYIRFTFFISLIGEPNHIIVLSLTVYLDVFHMHGEKI